MSNASTAQSISSAAHASEPLFKRDHPRRIDRYIDFFGRTETAPPGDPCGEVFLDGIKTDEDES